MSCSALGLRAAVALERKCDQALTCVVTQEIFEALRGMNSLQTKNTLFASPSSEPSTPSGTA